MKRGTVTGDAVDQSDVDVWLLLHSFGFVALDWVPPPRRRRNPVRRLFRILRGTW